LKEVDEEREFLIEDWEAREGVGEAEVDGLSRETRELMEKVGLGGWKKGKDGEGEGVGEETVKVCLCCLVYSLLFLFLFLPLHHLVRSFVPTLSPHAFARTKSHLLFVFLSAALHRLNRNRPERRGVALTLLTRTRFTTRHAHIRN